MLEHQQHIDQGSVSIFCQPHLHTHSPLTFWPQPPPPLPALLCVPAPPLCIAPAVHTHTGYTLTFLRSLSKTEYRLNGVITVTNPSGQGTAGLISVLLVLGSREVNVACQGMPADQQPYTLQPATVIECPFSQTWGTEPGTDTVSAYVQTSFGRAQAVAPVAFAFRQCGAAAADGSSLWAPCEVVERAACVSVTDGSYIVNK